MSHLTQEQGYTISVMLAQGYRKKDKSTAIGKDKSVVSCELKSNGDQRSGRYDRDLAQRMMDENPQTMNIKVKK